MSSIHVLLSDLNLDKEFLSALKKRDLEQKFVYLGEGAENYYAHKPLDSMSVEEYTNLLKKHIEKKEKIALISLGCGSLEREIGVAKLLCKDYEIMLFGVDSSGSMLRMAEKNLSKAKVPAKLIRADITSASFQKEINYFTRDYDKKIFTFLGRTMGNVSQTSMTDTLYDISHPGDFVWLDVVIRASLKLEDNLKFLKERAEPWIKKKEVADFLFAPLARIGIPRSVGEMITEMEEEDSAGVLRFYYAFQFKKPVTLDCRGEAIHILPPESIKLMDVRFYYPETMIKFFEGHGFKFLDSQVAGGKGQFLFKRKQ